MVQQTLNILENFDLKAMGHNTPEYIHTVAEALKLVFGDREAFYADPDFAEVPIDGLLSKEYAAERRNSIDMRNAYPEMHPAGDPWAYQESHGGHTVPQAPAPVSGPVPPDTSYACVVDRWGNAFSVTPKTRRLRFLNVPGIG